MTNSVTKLLGLPVLASEHGAGLDRLTLYVHILMAVLFVGWLGYFLFVLFRFNKRRNPKADYHGVRGHASSYLEGVVALIEAVLLIGFAIPLWAKVVDKFPEEKDSIVMRVIGQQFRWTAIYPGADGIFGKQDMKLSSGDNQFGFDKEDPNQKDDVTVVNDIVVPVNRNVIIHLTSMDVIHSFAVKPMRVTQDAVPGLTIPTWFKATHEGNYQITCAQLCGNSHYAMRGTLTVLSQEKYDEWLKGKSAGGAAAADYE